MSALINAFNGFVDEGDIYELVKHASNEDIVSAFMHLVQVTTNQQDVIEAYREVLKGVL